MKSSGEDIDRIRELAARGLEVDVAALLSEFPEESDSGPAARQTTLPRIGLVVLIAAIAVLVPIGLQRSNEFELTMHAAFAQGYEDGASLLMLKAASAEDLISEVERIRLFEGVEGGPIPYVSETDPSATFAKLEASPEMQLEYEAYLVWWSGVFRALGNVLVDAGKTEDAIRVFDHVVKRGMVEDRRDLAGLMYGLGELYKVVGEHQKAIALYEEMLELEPSDPRPAHYAGWSNYELREFDRALHFYERALEIDPGYAKVYFNRGLVHRELNQTVLFEADLRRALELTEAAYETGSQNPRIPFTLAILHATMGNLDETLLFLEQALQREQLRVFRAEHEPAFAALRQPESGVFHSRFEKLLARYRPAKGELGESTGAYDPSYFHE